MKAGAKKEFRVLLPAWILAVSAAFLWPSVTQMALRMNSGNLRTLVEKMPLIGVFLGCLVLAALSLGTELNHRTMGLLLAQPIERSRIWRSKTLPLIRAFISVGLALMAGQVLAGTIWGTSFEQWNGSGFLLFAAFLAGVMFSSAFWTLQLNSVIGGIVLPMAIQMLLWGIVTRFIPVGALGKPVEQQPGLWVTMGAGIIIYCVLFSYLGWRKFSRLQWQEGFIGESGMMSLSARRVKKSRFAVFRGPWSSLLSKELRLHLPVFLLASLFVVCWFTMLGLNALFPAWKFRLANGFTSIMFIYLPLIWLLSGCISLGEEKQLGTWEWHMTLPVSGLHQWAVKIAFAFQAALILGIVLPTLVSLAAHDLNVMIPEWGWNNSPSLETVMFAVCGTALCFWAATMFGSVVRAFFFSFIGTAFLAFCCAVMMSLWGWRGSGLFHSVCRWILIEFQFSFMYFADSNERVGTYIGMSLLLVLLLSQSYVYRRREPSRKTISKCSLILVAAVCLPLWLNHDIASSFIVEGLSLTAKLGDAVSRLPADFKDDILLMDEWRSYSDIEERAKPVSIEEIEKTGPLAPETRRWLRGTTLRFFGPPFDVGEGQTRVYLYGTFPNGRTFIVTILWTGTP